MKIKVGMVYRCKDDSEMMFAGALVKVTKVGVDRISYDYLGDAAKACDKSDKVIATFKKETLETTKLERLLLGIDAVSKDVVE
jgi:hypothetical protein